MYGVFSGRGYGQNNPHMQCRGSRRAFTTAGEESGLMPGYGMKRGSRTVLFLVAHALRRSQFSPSESLLRPSLRFRSVFPVENFTMRKFSAGNRRENAESRRDGRTLMRKGKNRPFRKYHFLRWHRISPSPSFPAYGTGFPCHR